MRLKISGGRLFDPACGWHGEARDLYIEGRRIVPRLSRVDRVMEAKGRSVVAGGIDLRGQVATYGLHFRRAAGGMPSPQTPAQGAWGLTPPRLSWATISP